MSSLIGRKIAGRYRVDQFLGQGGSAAVYRVWDEVRSAHLALKVLNEDLSADATFVARFRAEAAILAKLQHPNIVRFYSFVQENGRACILMDYVAGVTLGDEIHARGQPLESRRILEVLRDVCSALNYAHQLGYVHCDVKPANIRISTNGAALVTDFGIARLAGMRALGGGGTPGYMAPEQVRGEAPTPATDIYALGVLLFEMLTGGKRPFTRDSASAPGGTRERILWEKTHVKPRSPREYVSTITPATEAVVLRCLEANPSRRFASVWEFLHALSDSLAGADLPRRVQPEKETHKPVHRKILDILPARQGSATRRARDWLIVAVPLILVLTMILASGSGNPSSSSASAKAALRGTAMPLATPTPAWPRYSSGAKGFSIDYPPGWLYQDDSSNQVVVFGTSRELLMGEALPSSGAAMAIGRGPVLESFPEATKPYSPESLLDRLMVQQFKDIHQMQDVQTRYISSYPAAVGTYGASSQTGIKALLELTLVVDGDNYTLLMAVVPEAEWQLYKPVFERMRNSLVPQAFVQ